MWLQTLQAHGLRCFKQVDLSFTPGINVLFGDNGAGKTSILEGISVLSCGKSFRTSKLSHIINHHATELVLLGEVLRGDQSIQLGVQYKTGLSELRVDQTSVAKWSELAKNLPVLDIHPESYLLITGGPIVRRKFLNWGMFHVEHGYGKTWLDYSRALKQRNNALRNRKPDQASNWHHTLADLGNIIAMQLLSYTESITPIVNQIADQFELTDQLTLEYDPGWDQSQELQYLLDQELNQENYSQSTMFGPHRGDLKIKWSQNLFSKISSRGQQKVLAIALKIAQSEYLKVTQNKQSIYLIDELPAELDSKRREKALNLLNTLNSQIIITAVTKHSADYKNNDVKWFHVEHTHVSSVV